LLNHPAGGREGRPEIVEGSSRPDFLQPLIHINAKKRRPGLLIIRSRRDAAIPLHKVEGRVSQNRSAPDVAKVAPAILAGLIGELANMMHCRSGC